MSPPLLYLFRHFSVAASTSSIKWLFLPTSESFGISEASIHDRRQHVLGSIKIQGWVVFYSDAYPPLKFTFFSIYVKLKEDYFIQEHMFSEFW